MYWDNRRKVKLNLIHVLRWVLWAKEALLCSTETRWTLWLFFRFLGENSIHMVWNQRLICQFKSHHYTLPPPPNFCCCFANRRSPGSRYVLRQRSEICQLFIPFAEPLLESKSPSSFLLFPAGYKQLLFWKERLCTIVILSNLKKKHRLFVTLMSYQMISVLICKTYYCVNCETGRSVDSMVGSNSVLLGPVLAAHLRHLSTQKVCTGIS